LNRRVSSSETLADVGEFGAIARLVGRFPSTESVLVGPGDDAAQVVVGGGRVLVSTDVLVDGRHFRRDWAAAHDVGRRAAAQSLSDLNAMGGSTTAVVVGVTAPADLPLDWMLELAAGLAEECALVGAAVVGGDLTRGDLLTLGVTALGAVESGDPVLRSGARPGDVVAMRGRQGWAAAGLAVLQRGFRSPRAVVEAYRRPEVPYGAGAEARAAGATAMVDVSDGLVADLAHLAAASGVAVDLRTEALEVDEPLRAVGAALGVDPLQFVLGGGDDHPVVACFPAAGDVPRGWVVVGEVAGGDGVTVDGTGYEGPTGWRHY
jgi:thiamine-monophosphate kinase